MTVVAGVRRVATYERVSSEDQRERETIKTQTDTLDRRLALEPGIEIIERFADDGISGTKPLAERPGGRALLAAAEAGLFDELWLYALDRLGRNLADMAAMGRRLEGLNVAVVTLREGRLTPFMFDLFSMLAQNEHRVFHERTADGINRAAREARYTGGVMALGYRVEGVKGSGRPVPDESLLWADLTAADLIRRIYSWIALDGWSCRRVASELNALGVPTACAREGTGVRVRATQSIWRPGLIRNMVTNSIYKGQLSYGRRTKKRDREVIVGSIEGLVSSALWDEAQATLARNRRCTKNTHRVYLLKGVMTCGVCGLTYVGSWSKDIGWYRCGGQLVERGPIPGRCLGTSVRNDAIEPPVWHDIEVWLRNPGDVLDALDGASEREAQGAIAEAESITLARALKSLDDQKARMVKSVRMGVLTDAEVRAELSEIASQRATLEARVAAVQAPEAEVVPQAVHDLLAEIRARLDAGLTDPQRQEIVRLLASVVIHTALGEDGKKTAKALVTYRFPGVVPTCTGTGSWQRSHASE
jgi:site-specific DNA recombinase